MSCCHTCRELAVTFVFNLFQVAAEPRSDAAHKPTAIFLIGWFVILKGCLVIGSSHVLAHFLQPIHEGTENGFEKLYGHLVGQLCKEIRNVIGQPLRPDREIVGTEASVLLE